MDQKDRHHRSLTLWMVFISNLLFAAPHRGFVLNLHAGLKTNEIHTLIDEIKNLQANSVAFKFEEFTKSENTFEIYPNPERTVPYTTLKSAIEHAHMLGLSVTLLPVLLLQTPSSDEHWRGNIKPKSISRWFFHYGQFLEKYILLANLTNVKTFSIGSELSSMEYEVDEWKKLIRHIKSIYKGDLIYTFNWDHLSYTVAWQSLDGLGISAYYELAKPNTATTLENLMDTYRPIQAKIKQWSLHYQKPVYFMEIGFPSRRNGLYNPWNHTIESESSDMLVQSMGFEAFLKTFYNHPKTHAVYIYEWSKNGGPQDRGYSPRGKKGLDLIKDYFNRT